MNGKSLFPLLALLPSCTQTQTQEHLNILFIIADDLRPELGCYGAPQVLTPNIDRFADGSALFTNAYCNIPVSGASRASLLTGLYPSLPERFEEFDAWAQKDAPDIVPISRWFREHGYTALSNGKVFHNLQDHYDSWSRIPWRLNPEGYGKDWADYNKWELWLNEESASKLNPRTGRGPFCEAADKPDSAYDDGQITLKTIADLQDLARTGEPFFLAVGFWRPHLPFNAPLRYWEMYDRDRIETADNRFRPESLPEQVTGSTEILSYGAVGATDSDDFHREARHGYYACVSFIDAQVGMILDELKRLGLDKNTAVIFIGDHGWHLGEHEFWGKHNLMHHATNAPLIIRIPGESPRRVESIAEFVDIYPTLCAAAGIPAPAHLQGVSLLPLIDGSRKRLKDYAFIQWKQGVNVVDTQGSYAAWNEDGERTAEMYFDHRQDPQENRNVIGSSEKEVKRYRKAMENFLSKIRP